MVRGILGLLHVQDICANGCVSEDLRGTLDHSDDLEVVCNPLPEGAKALAIEELPSRKNHAQNSPRVESRQTMLDEHTRTVVLGDWVHSVEGLEVVKLGFGWLTSNLWLDVLVLDLGTKRWICEDKVGFGLCEVREAVTDCTLERQTVKQHIHHHKAESVFLNLPHSKHRVVLKGLVSGNKETARATTWIVDGGRVLNLVFLEDALELVNSHVYQASGSEELP